MLGPADASLARRDPALVGLAVLLDADAFGDLLRRSIPRLGVTSVRPVYVRYKPGTRCLVSYEVSTLGAAVHVHANAYTAHRFLEKSVAARHVMPAAGPLAYFLAEPGIVITVFPHDEELPCLARIWETTGRNDVLEKLLPRRSELWDPGLGVLAYKPGRRCVAALKGNGTAAVLKAYTAAGFAHAARAAKAFHSDGPLRVARMLGRSRRHHLVAFEWLPGDSVSELLRQRRAGADCLKPVGAALARLHAQKGRRLSQGSGDAGLGDELRAVGSVIGWLCPPFEERAARLALEITARLQQAGDNVPLHGDFHAGQVLVAPETIGIIDMDRAGRGDPRTDLATFIAHLECDVVSGRLESSTVEEVSNALIDGYEDTSRRSLRVSLEPYVAAALLRLATNPFRTREPEWQARTAAIVSRAESLLRKPQRKPSRAPASIVCDPFGVIADRGLALPPIALDPATMSRRLACLVMPRGGSIDVRAVRVSRHKPGRRCLIEYDLSIADTGGPARIDTVIAKVRGKGADSRAYRLSRALWRNGFGDDSSDRVSVPRPLGVLVDLKMWIQLKVPGTRLTTLLPEGGAALGERVADAIWKLHCHEPVNAPVHTVDDELRILRERLHAVAAEATVPASRLNAIFECCARIAGTLPRGTLRGIHRDFYADQVVEHGGRMYLLDLDLYSAGDPALDVGNFLGHITEYSLRTHGDPTRLQAFETAMTHRFLTLEPTVSAASIEIYKTLTLARLIHISTLLAERRPFTGRIVDLVETRLTEHVAYRRAVPK